MRLLRLDQLVRAYERSRAKKAIDFLRNSLLDSFDERVSEVLCTAAKIVKYALLVARLVIVGARILILWAEA